MVPYVAKKANLQRQPSVVLVKKVQRTEERKNIDSGTVTGTITAAQTTASLLLLNGCDDGATSTTRIGRRITMTSMEIRWLGAVVATTSGASPLRMCVVYDRQSNALTPAAIDVFATDIISTMMNLSNSRRFKVLVDELIDPISSGGPSGWNVKHWRDFTAKGTKEGLQVEFNENSTATVSSIISGSIYAFF